MQSLYENPKYYEIAFSFRNIPAEVDVFEESIKQFSRIPVKRMLDIGCGNCPHMEELVKRGYEYVGIDSSQTMLDYSRQKASFIGASVQLVYTNMVDFSLDSKVDFAYVLLGSLYVKNTAELISHFNSVSRALRSGGLYFLDWCVQFDPLSDKSDSWEMERDGIKTKVSYSMKMVNRMEQTVEETITLDVNDHGETKTLVERNVNRAIYPQEFLIFISGRDDFEFVGWWNNWDLSKPLQGDEHINRPITVVRRT